MSLALDNIDVLRHGWEDAVSTVTPDLPIVLATMEEAFANAVEDGQLDEQSLLQAVRDIVAVASKSGGADNARLLSKALHRSVYEYLLSLDALTAQETAEPAHRPGELLDPSRLIGAEEVAELESRQTAIAAEPQGDAPDSEQPIESDDDDAPAVVGEAVAAEEVAPEEPGELDAAHDRPRFRLFRRGGRHADARAEPEMTDAEGDDAAETARPAETEPEAPAATWHVRTRADRDGDAGAADVAEPFSNAAPPPAIAHEAFPPTALDEQAAAPYADQTAPPPPPVEQAPPPPPPAEYSPPPAERSAPPQRPAPELHQPPEWWRGPQVTAAPEPPAPAEPTVGALADAIAEISGEMDDLYAEPETDAAPAAAADFEPPAPDPEFDAAARQPDFDAATPEPDFEAPAGELEVEAPAADDVLPGASSQPATAPLEAVSQEAEPQEAEPQEAEPQEAEFEEAELESLVGELGELSVSATGAAPETATGYETPDASAEPQEAQPRGALEAWAESPRALAWEPLDEGSLVAAPPASNGFPLEDSIFTVAPRHGFHLTEEDDFFGAEDEAVTPPPEPTATPAIPAADTDDDADSREWHVRRPPQANDAAEPAPDGDALAAMLDAAEDEAMLLEEDPAVGKARNEIGDRLRRRRCDEAASLLQRLATDVGGRAVAELALDAGDRCRALGKANAALSCYIAATRADPVFEGPLLRLADICLDDRDIDLAVSYLDRVARLHRMRGDARGAVRIYRKIATIAPYRDDILATLMRANATGQFED